MRSYDVISRTSNRNEGLRLLMIIIIAASFPFYCLAIVLIGSAPVERAPVQQTQTASPVPSFTPLGAGQSRAPTFTPLAITQTPLSALPATPAQFVPPTPLPAYTLLAQTVVSPSPIPILVSTTAAPPASADADFDGMPDVDDRCPDEFGYADNEGCPYPDDVDRDGFRDADDHCPNEFAPYTPRGCRDQDDDGLDTADDQCPQQPGSVANRGCPADVEAGG